MVPTCRGVNRNTNTSSIIPHVIATIQWIVHALSSLYICICYFFQLWGQCSGVGGTVGNWTAGDKRQQRVQETKSIKAWAPSTQSHLIEYRCFCLSNVWRIGSCHCMGRSFVPWLMLTIWPFGLHQLERSPFLILGGVMCFHPLAVLFVVLPISTISPPGKTDEPLWWSIFSSILKRYQVKMRVFLPLARPPHPPGGSVGARDKALADSLRLHQYIPIYWWCICILSTPLLGANATNT